MFSVGFGPLEVPGLLRRQRFHTLGRDEGRGSEQRAVYSWKAGGGAQGEEEGLCVVSSFGKGSLVLETAESWCICLDCLRKGDGGSVSWPPRCSLVTTGDLLGTASPA